MGKIVTFYSYKGSVGRSMALANTATLLTRWGYRTLMIDWDLDDPGGLEQFFQGYLPSENAAAKEGVLDLLHRKGSSAPAGSWKESLVPLDLHVGDNLPGDGKLELLRAGQYDADGGYFKKLHGFNVERFYSEGGGANYIEGLRREWKTTYDFVLVDCASGLSAFGSICTIQLPDILVLLVPTNEQGLTRAVNVARRVTKARRRLPFDRVELLTIPVPARLDQSELAQKELWLDRFETGVAEFYEDWLPRDFLRRDILADTLIPYQRQFGYGENLASLRRQVPTRKGVAKAYESIAALLANDLQEAKRLHTDREGYVNQAWKNLTLPMIKNLHVEWLDSKGESGKRANLNGGDYHGQTLIKARLSEALFIGVNLRSASLLGADVKRADFSGANLENANLKEVKGEGAKLEGANLDKAELKHSHFFGANFRGASLREASLIKADLRSADFQAASLSKASLEDAQLYKANFKKASLKGATGLTARQFKGVDLAGAELPENLLDFAELHQAQKLSRIALGLFVLLFAFCLYTSAVILVLTDDAFLVTNRSLGPLAGGIPTMWFFKVAPLILLGLYFVFLLLIQRLWNRLVELPASFPDGSTLNEKISDWFMAAVAYPYFAGRVGTPKWRRLTLSLFTRGLVPLSQVLFWWKVMPLRNWRFTSFQVLLVTVTAALGAGFQRQGAKTLRTNNTGDHWEKEKAEEVATSRKAEVATIRMAA